MEGHGATERRAVMFKSLVISSKHLGAADLCWFAIGRHCFFFFFSVGYSVSGYWIFLATVEEEQAKGQY